METNQSAKCTKLNDPVTKACVNIDIDDDGNSSNSSSSDESDDWSEQKKWQQLFHDTQMFCHELVFWHSHSLQCIHNSEIDCHEAHFVGFEMVMFTTTMVLLHQLQWCGHYDLVVLSVQEWQRSLWMFAIIEMKIQKNVLTIALTFYYFCGIVTLSVQWFHGETMLLQWWCMPHLWQNVHLFSH